MDKITKQLLEKLRRLEKDPESVKDYSRFNKDKKPAIKITTPILRKVSAEYYVRIKGFDKEKIFRLSEELLSSRVCGHTTIAFDWVYRIRKKYAGDDFDLFESWLKKYVKSWGSCDDLCTHAFGYLLWQYPKLVSRVRRWISSDNMWLRRASAVIMIYSGRKGMNHDFSFEVAEKLMEDREDLVQKGYGWLLKEISASDEKRVFGFIMKHKKKMTRTALRYAIEKIPPALRKQAMEK